jgi:hypothetical protein
MNKAREGEETAEKDEGKRRRETCMTRMKREEENHKRRFGIQ